MYLPPLPQERLGGPPHLEDNDQPSDTQPITRKWEALFEQICNCIRTTRSYVDRVYHVDSMLYRWIPPTLSGEAGWAFTERIVTSTQKPKPLQGMGRFS